MSKMGVLVFGVLPILAATAAVAQTPPQASGTVQAPVTLPGEVMPRPLAPPAVARIGGFEVRAWAPVEEPYNQYANRAGSADPLLADQPWWWATGSMPPG